MVVYLKVQEVDCGRETYVVSGLLRARDISDDDI